MYNTQNNVYQTFNYNINLDLKHIFKNIIKNLKEYIQSLVNKSEEYYIISIKKSLNNIANILESTPQLSIEFLEFLKIKKMLFYILDNYNSLNNSELNKYFDLITSFHKLLLLKINYLQNNDLKIQYDTEHKQFKYELKSLRKDFHNNIYERLDTHDDIMIKVSKILME